MQAVSKQGIIERALPYPGPAADLYRALRHLPQPVLLSSGKDNGAAGRFEILTAAPAKHLVARGMETTVTHAGGRRETVTGSPLDALREFFDYPALDLELPADCPFAGGAVGYFAYELQHPGYRIDPAAEDDIGLPAMRVGIYHWAVVVDHLKRYCRFVALPSCPRPLREEVLACLTETEKVAVETGFTLRGALRSNFTRREYLQAFYRVIDYIHAGDCYQVNLAQRFSGDFEGDSFAAFEHLQGLANAPFAAYMGEDEEAVLCFSPERFIQVADGRVVSQPIKGTRPRDPDPDRDQALLRDLVASIKDRAENLMIVDLLRNDLGRVCRTGSIRVPSLFEAHSFRNVHHLISTIEGTLERPAHVFELFKASFPGGSVTGTPKIRAMEIINELETRPRSVYCGSVAYIGFDGRMDSNICIRTLVCAGGRIHCWGGGGIVADSKGEQEYQETLDKIGLFMDNLL